VVVKRLAAKAAMLEEQVTGRWLPAVGLDGLGPPRRASVGEPDGRHVWHVYDDLGAWGLDREDVDTSCLEAAMDRLADLHAAFAGHAMLAEPRFAAGDLGVYFYVNSVRDAARCVARLRPPAVQVSPEEAQARDAVEGHLARLLADEPRRVGLLREQAGPETVVHGDLTRANVFVPPALGGRGAPGQRVRLIDWDHVGVAPAGFDISTHLAHYPRAQRDLVLDRYTGAMAQRGFPFPRDTDWDLLVATFEAGRLANQIIWIAISILEGSEWGFPRLKDWSDALAAVAPGPRDSAPGVGVGAA
jgi:thiamine kinase-like enzyme